ncbi:hypothetical protein BCR34DRAFT_99689 [Clohesyomyces aquaticus]|uniref:Uncharacterized protein n=1 Tax=Clohesyomyces aquaticus TaxID=1231657 RepID=A0A1Y1YTY7_9PLEO|nr:hypothetical protein BCR34DRAFT_99689 [Clohesyomyces aquaticus]
MNAWYLIKLLSLAFCTCLYFPTVQMLIYAQCQFLRDSSGLHSAQTPHCGSRLSKYQPKDLFRSHFKYASRGLVSQSSSSLTQARFRDYILHSGMTFVSGHVRANHFFQSYSSYVGTLCVSISIVHMVRKQQTSIRRLTTS